ncbi:MAG: DUF4265 domain-containing protein [Aquabacterium sp.]|nr:MAG: DUF4265 domain-containing protein [Aquabacterium sp.]
MRTATGNSSATIATRTRQQTRIGRNRPQRDISMQASDSIKLTFRLSEDEQGPYPVSTESLWCRPQDGGRYRIENIPFFLEGLSWGDVVAVEELEDEPGVHRVEEIVEESGYSTVWVLVKDTKAGKAVLDELSSMGCSRESGVLPDLYAVSVPPTVDLQEVVDRLDAASESDLLAADYPSVRQ